MCGSDPKDFSEAALASDLLMLVSNHLYDVSEGNDGPAGRTDEAGTPVDYADFPEYLEIESLVRRSPENEENVLVTQAGINRLIAFLQSLNVE